MTGRGQEGKFWASWMDLDLFLFFIFFLSHQSNLRLGLYHHFCKNRFQNLGIRKVNNQIIHDLYHMPVCMIGAGVGGAAWEEREPAFVAHCCES